MTKINIKPLSVNQAYFGKRLQSFHLKNYHQDLYKMLPKLKVPEGKLKLSLVFGMSSKGSDVDNCVKPFQDILQKVYEFNDNRIYELQVKKEDVKKGQEFIDFNIEQL